jgi:hypothetical protein
MKIYRFIKIIGLISVSIFLVDSFYPFLPKLLKYVTGVTAIISILLDYYFVYFKLPKDANKN